MEQENIKFLSAFCSWLKCWDDIVVIDRPKSCGKLSRQTFSALLHTTETLIKLCEYLLKDLKLHYVMLGVFQTDDLEQRFGKYRQMSGCNYNVSVQQIIESERKIKVTNLLKLKSRQVEALNVSEMINDINTASENVHGSDDFLLPVDYDDFINYSDEIEIDSSTLEIIIFLAGYVGFKVCVKCDCQFCKTLLLTNSDLSYELPPETRYLNLLNRGGLKYPSDTSIYLGIQAYKTFQVLVSEKFRNTFLISKQPKFAVKFLTLQTMQLNDSTIVCECGKTLNKLIGQCMNIWANIFLNNYAKIQTNMCVEESVSKRNCNDAGDNPKKRARKAAIFMKGKN